MLYKLTLNVIPTVNVIKVNAKCNKRLTLNVIKINAKCNTPDSP